MVAELVAYDHHDIANGDDGEQDEDLGISSNVKFTKNVSNVVEREYRELNRCELGKELFSREREVDAAEFG